MQQVGRYEIIRELGRGSMGVVYAAIDPLIGRMVALKTIRLDTQGSAESQAELTRRLYREAQSAGILSHPGIITIHDIGERAKMAYIVMEYVTGTNLEDLLASGVPQHSETLFSILQQAATALDYAHGKGVIHRDIKPSNIMICQDGSVKIADFGVAKMSASMSMTQAGLVIGTPNYMSPEQAQGLPISGCTDQFSLAVVAYRVLTGMLPFQGPTLTALLTKILIEEPHYEGAGLHPYLQTVFRKALAKDPTARFESCMEFVQKLENAYALCGSEIEAHASHVEAPIVTPAKNGLQESAATVVVREESIEKETPPTPRAPEVPVEQRKGKSTPIAWIASLAILTLAAIAFFSFKALERPDTSEQDLKPNETVAVPANPALVELGDTKAKAPIEPEPLKAQPKKPTALPKLPPSNKEATPSENTSPEKQDPAASPDNAPRYASGTILWTGRIEKNTVLVLSPRQASIGSVVGELPGKPVSIELEPRDLVVRQMPSPENQWKQIILYTGPNRYKSITIYWKTTQ